MTGMGSLLPLIKGGTWMKRFIAIALVAVLVGMYAATLVFAAIGNMTLFKAFLACDVIIPVMIWIIRIFIKIGRPDNSEFDARVKDDQETRD